MNKYTFWLKTALISQFLTGLIHASTFLIEQQPTNETEKQLLGLMNNYHADMGAGFNPTMKNLMDSFSISFCLLLFLGGFINLFLIRKKAGPEIMKGIIGINVLIFGICFVQIAFLTFLPPMICTGIIFVSLLLSYLIFPKVTQKV
jgi:multisubunit Na+/H+ antiporter MnhF subunit